MAEYLTPMGPTKLHVNPIFEIGPCEPRFTEWIVFEGISVNYALLLVCRIISALELNVLMYD